MSFLVVEVSLKITQLITDIENLVRKYDRKEINIKKMEYVPIKNDNKYSSIKINPTKTVFKIKINIEHKLGKEFIDLLNIEYDCLRSLGILKCVKKCENNTLCMKIKIKQVL